MQVLRYLGRYTPSGRHFQSQNRDVRWRAGHLSLQRLCPWRQASPDDIAWSRVISAGSSCMSYRRICPHPSVRVPGQLLANCPPCSLPPNRWRLQHRYNSLRHHTYPDTRLLALSPMRSTVAVTALVAGNDGLIFADAGPSSTNGD